MNLDLVALNRLIKELDESVELIEERANLALGSLSQANVAQDEFTDSKSLLAKCEKAVLNHSKPKPVIRLLHHLACSGGTLISKCLAAQPNVFILSELHPFSTLHLGEKAKYLPADITTQARYGRLPDIEELAAELFVANIKHTEKHVRQRGGHLVLRVHNHVDYCLGDNVQPFERVSQLLTEHFELIQLVTIRDPIDAYRSLQENGWLHFNPNTFDEYCRRVQIFLEHCHSIPTLRYEDFVSNPQQTMLTITDILKIPFNENFSEIYELFNVSGDSGRSGGDICARERRTLSEDFLAEIEKSENYKKIAAHFEY
ncbi:sulfotransferase [Rheinheimera sp. UJ51]|uniref:sulfotransferase n=1 Tax=Rheinheimera sp. UJ51 TaxID=2892446 RepID=UPI001E3CC05D|nr:sulfotransferase [Rheinheimera sp. UJ51]MCC5450293.1 sulfotransferase [Rheinheimera sp. UJ51]